MTRSQRRIRAREGQDSAGDDNYPGSDYTFDWPGTWPSGSGGGISVAPGGTRPSTFAYTEGMRLDAHPDFAELTDTANWQTAVENAVIDFAGFLVNGSPGNAATIVQTGETVTLLVTDTAAPISQYEYTIDASVNAFILTQPQPVEIMEGDTANFSVFAPTAAAYMWEYSVDGTVWQQGFNSNLQSSYPDWTGTASDASVGETWQITDAHVDMNTMLVRCYLNGGAFITDEVALSVTDVLEQPAVLTPASITGNAVAGQTLTGTPATFSGGMVTVTNLWQVSDNGSSGWTSTGNTTTTSPAQVLGKYYRFVSTGDNGVGTPAVSNSNVIGPAVEAPQTATVNSVVAGPQVDDAIPITVTATGAENGDGVYWVLYPAAEAKPSPQQVRDGQRANGTAATDSGDGVWPGPFSEVAVAGIAFGEYQIAVVIENAAGLSNSEESAPFTVDTTSPALNTPVATKSGDNIAWTVNSNEGRGTVYAALRLSASAVLSPDDIINGTGNAIDTDSAAASVGANAGAFLNPANGTYRVDMVQVDASENLSAVVTSNEVVLSSTIALTALGCSTASTDADYGVLEIVNFLAASEGEWLLFVCVGSDGTLGTTLNSLTLEGVAATQFPSPNFASSRTRAAMFKMQCPTDAAENEFAEILTTVLGATPDAEVRTFVWRCSGEPTVVQSATDFDDAVTLNVSLTGTVANNPVVAAVSVRGDGGALTGVTEEMAVTGGRDRRAGQNTNASGGTRTITAVGLAISMMVSAEIGAA